MTLVQQFRAHDPAGGSYLPLLIQGRQLRRSLSLAHVAAVLGLGTVRGNELLVMLDWLLARRQWIEKSLARSHPQAATVMLYDVSSTYLEGRHSPLAAFGHSRDGKPAKQQLVFGLLCAADGCPVAVEVFAGNTADPRTVAGQVDKLHQRCGVRSPALVGDRGMLTTARLREDLEPLARAGLDLGTAVGPAGALRPGELVPNKVAEIHNSEFPGERLLVCLNPCLRAERARKREDLLQTTEAALQRIQRAVQAKRLRGRAAIKQRVGRDVARALRSLKTSQLHVRPVYVYNEDHVRAHVLLCMLAYFLEWHLRQRLAPLLFEEQDREAAHLAGRQGFGEHAGEAGQQADSRRPASAQSDDLAGRSGNPHAERSGAAGGPRAQLPIADPSNSGAAQGVRLARSQSGTICCQ